MCVHVVGRTVREGGEVGLGGGDCCGCEWWFYVLCLIEGDKVCGGGRVRLKRVLSRGGGEGAGVCASEGGIRVFLGV